MQPSVAPRSSAEEFFRRVFAPGAGSFGLIENLVIKQAEENEWREFKDASWFDAPLPLENPAEERKRRTEVLKKKWSESLSAFGNSGDGLLIWGINAPARLAVGLSLPRDAEALAARLRELQMNAVEPPVADAEVRAALKPGGSDGFVVCYIPHSAFAPHCANWAAGGYYIRGQDSNTRMRPEVLKKMFYPQTGPRLIPVVRLSVAQGDDRRYHTAMRIELRNSGSGSAKGTFVDLQARGGGVFNRHLNRRLWKERYHTGDSGYECVATIHPGEKVLLMGNLTAAGAADSPDVLNRPIECTFGIFAENADAIRAELRFEPSEIFESFNSKKPIDREAKIGPFHP